MTKGFRIVVIGLGTQGKKRKVSSGKEFVFGIDPFHSEANYRSIFEVPINLYDAAFVCTPESEKIPIIKYLIENDKHVLCEKPLITSSIDELKSLEESASKKRIVLYTAYNHRFEPAMVESAKIVDSGKLGKIYKIRIFYGNGTARLVKESAWRDNGMGVVSDIGSHLIDLIDFLLPNARIKYKALRAIAFENRAYDHALMQVGTFHFDSQAKKAPFRNSRRRVMGISPR